FGTGLFQCIYQPGPSHWAMLPSTLEWHVAVVALALTALMWPGAGLAAAGMLLLSVLGAVLQACQGRLPPCYDGCKARCLVTVLSYLQPLVRSWARYRTRLLAYRPPDADPALAEAHGGERLPLRGQHQVAYWSEEGYDRTELVGLVIAYLNER